MEIENFSGVDIELRKWHVWDMRCIVLGTWILTLLFCHDGESLQLWEEGTFVLSFLLKAPHSLTSVFICSAFISKQHYFHHFNLRRHMLPKSVSLA